MIVNFQQVSVGKKESFPFFHKNEQNTMLIYFDYGNVGKKIFIFSGSKKKKHL